MTEKSCALRGFCQEKLLKPSLLWFYNAYQVFAVLWTRRDCSNVFLRQVANDNVFIDSDPDW
jgi:hypothetical protein